MPVIIRLHGVPSLASPAALQNIHQRAPLIVSVLIVVLFGLYLAGQIRAWLQLTQAPTADTVEADQPAGVAPDLQRMERLFGTSTTNDPVYAPNTANTDLTLLGSFVHADPARSSAIIQMSGQPPQLYGIEQELEPGVRLYSVHPDRVEISRNGRVESLYFPSTRSATAIPDSLPDYSEPAATDQPDPQAEMLQQQMEALRQQMEGVNNSPDALPSDEQPTEDN
ncbi:type II secretion system protein N [Stutzerimonas stutzeri]|uniref:type II secretion system protein N n=1 Tax=Stutzerimonas stutzeri TaxID=316 RepID=UPI001C2EBAB4|nr:type II secretion system protein N [Stutzerimonas stutzeri]